jgi:hypothetical protein
LPFNAAAALAKRPLGRFGPSAQLLLDSLSSPSAWRIDQMALLIACGATYSLPSQPSPWWPSGFKKEGRVTSLTPALVATLRAAWFPI